ncbi:MAG: hypothetical protein ABW184_18000 [Sphingobium sp.]
MRISNIIAGTAAVLLVAGFAAPAAQAQTSVNLLGTVANLCVLTVTTPGVLTAAPTGIELSSAQTGGVPALLAVIATGAHPTITFTAPGVTGPSAAGATTQMSFTSGGGANRAFDSAGYSFTANRLLDTVTINGKTTNASGFATGLYTVSTTATCSQ